MKRKEHGGLPAAIEAVLEADKFEYVRAGVGTWRLPPGTLAPGAVEVTMAGDWICCQLDLAETFASSELPTLLAADSRLPGRAKFVIDPPSHRLSLREDVAIAEDLDVARGVRRALANLHCALPLLGGLTPVETQREEAPPNLPSSLREALTEAGWQLIPPAGKKGARVPLPGTTGKARFSPAGQGGWRTYVELSELGPSHPSSEAAALLLLTANWFLRLPRSGVETGHGGRRAFFEAYLDESPSSMEIDLALSSLAMAFRFFARELAGLAEEAMAQRFLSTRRQPAAGGERAPSTQGPMTSACTERR